MDAGSGPLPALGGSWSRGRCPRPWKCPSVMGGGMRRSGTRRRAGGPDCGLGLRESGKVWLQAAPWGSVQPLISPPKASPLDPLHCQGAVSGASQPTDEGEKPRVEVRGTANYIALGRRGHSGCPSPCLQPPDLRIWGHLLILPAPLTPSSPIPSITLIPTTHSLSPQLLPVSWSSPHVGPLTSWLPSCPSLLGAACGIHPSLRNPSASQIPPPPRSLL